MGSFLRERAFFALMQRGVEEIGYLNQSLYKLIFSPSLWEKGADGSPKAILCRSLYERGVKYRFKRALAPNTAAKADLYLVYLSVS